jgi:hypothetical protein
LGSGASIKDVGEPSGRDDRGWKPLPQVLSDS